MTKGNFKGFDRMSSEQFTVQYTESYLMMSQVKDINGIILLSWKP